MEGRVKPLPFLTGFTESSTSFHVIDKEISQNGVIVYALLRKGRLKVSMFWWERAVDILVQEALELIFIPSGISLFSFHNKSRISSDPVTQGFIDSKWRLNIYQLNEETMLIEPSQFSEPVWELYKLLLQIRWKSFHITLMKLVIQSSLVEQKIAGALLNRRSQERQCSKVGISLVTISKWTGFMIFLPVLINNYNPMIDQISNERFQMEGCISHRWSSRRDSNYNL